MAELEAKGYFIMADGTKSSDHEVKKRKARKSGKSKTPKKASKKKAVKKASKSKTKTPKVQDEDSGSG